ncbi:amidohydrolase [Castellaniella sp. GW247-6E4]|uniref:amidohydrolase n=1 Tax=Castellaniella sp. GW247-6E4 TaxID=3140380 RepID=UPI0033160A78
MNPLTAALDIEASELLPKLESIYKDLHRNPELSMQEVRSADVTADYLQTQGFEVARRVGVTGVVGLLRNGEGPTVMLRADMDALPVVEATGLPYASSVRVRDEDGAEVGVSHVCGHDLHMTWLMGVARILSRHRDAWAGTVLAVFQPGEEVGLGAQSMIDDGMFERFPKPDVVLGQHVVVGEAGTVGYRSGVILSAGDSLKVKLFGRGAHGSQPQTAIDPVIMAAATAMRLQTIVSREIAPTDNAVLTIGSLHAGVRENIIPEDATLRLNIRTTDEGVRATMLAAVRRICCAECQASNAPREPEFTTISSFPVTRNDVESTERIALAFKAQFGERAYETEPAGASEDFSLFGRAWQVPYVFWFVGGTDAETYARAKAAGQLNTLPNNHSPKFAPVIHPTLGAGLQAMLTAASVWLCNPARARHGTLRPREET